MTTGVNVDGVYKLGGDVFGMGWSDRIPDPLAVESKPGSTRGIESNQALVKDSDGRLPEIDTIKLRHLAMSCNHTVWFLKCALAGTPCDNPKLSRNGRLSLALIEEGDPLFAKRIREGMVWMVLDWRVEEHYPDIVEMLIQAKNLPGEINRRISVFEVLQQIFNLSKITLDPHGRPDWPVVVRHVARSRPSCLDMLEELVEFVIACSGGASGVFLQEQIGLWRNCELEGLNRTIPSKIWRALAGSGSPDGDAMPRFKNMFILTTFTAGKETVEDGVCHFITTADCEIFNAQSQSPNWQRVLACNQVLNDGFELIGRCLASGVSAHPDVSASSGASALSPCVAEKKTVKLATLKFACSIVRFALSSQLKQRQDVKRGLVYNTVEAIGFDLLETLKAHYKNVSELAPQAVLDTWRPDVPEKSEKKQAAPEGIRLREMTKDGKLAKLEDQLFQQGFRIGDHVLRKTTRDLWVIASCEDRVVVLELLQDKERKDEKPLALFLAHYTRPAPGFESKVLVEDALWQRVDPRSCRAGCAALAKAEVLKALEIAAVLHADARQAVQPMLNLKKALAGVVASKNAKAGSIVLLPWTTTIHVDFPDDPAFKRHQPWTVEFGTGSPLARFVGEDRLLPRVSLLPWSTSEKPDRKQEDKKTEGDAAKTKPEVKKQEDKKQEDTKQEDKKEQDKEQDKKQEAKQEQQAKQEEADDKKVNRMAVFWRVQGCAIREKRPEEFNMEIGHITVDSWGQIIVQSKNIGAKSAPKPDFAQSACMTKVILPVLTNKRDVCRGEALIYVKKEAPPALDKGSKPLTQRPLLHKMLTGAAGSEPAAKRSKFA